MQLQQRGRDAFRVPRKLSHASHKAPFSKAYDPEVFVSAKTGVKALEAAGCNSIPFPGTGNEVVELNPQPKGGKRARRS